MALITGHSTPLAQFVQHLKPAPVILHLITS
nr:MAG TPA: hypothetical protein [Caudoviricetes sp.]